MFLPLESRDEFGSIVRKRNQVYEVFRELITYRGYQEISTPVLEYAQTFTNPNAGMSLQDMMKWFNHEGEIEVLRPDWTIGIARALAKQPQRAQKWAYQGSIFRRDHPGIEIHQAGVEVLYYPTLHGEVETILTADRFMNQLNIHDYLIELAHTGIFDQLVQKLQLSFHQAEELRNAMRDKNRDKVVQITSECHPTEIADELIRLIDAFGSIELIDEYAERWKDDEVLSGIIQHLKSLIRILTECGIKDILVDLGRVKSLPYYSGTLFRGYLKKNGTICFSGGRYDQLYKQFDKTISAVGLAFHVDLLAEHLDEARIPRICIIANDETIGMAEKLRDSYKDRIVDVKYELDELDCYDQVLQIVKKEDQYEVKSF